MARPKSEDKKQALLEAATAAFAQSGIAASTSAIARSAGVAEGTLFRYFATKDDLLNELYLTIKADLVQTMIAGLNPNETRPKENMRNIWNSYIGWGVRNPMEHKAIRRMALSERITDETRNRVQEMFPELNNCASAQSNPFFNPMSTVPSAMRCFFRWPKPPLNTPATSRSEPSVLSSWALKLCGRPLPRTIADGSPLAA